MRAILVGIFLFGFMPVYVSAQYQSPAAQKKGAVIRVVDIWYHSFGKVRPGPELKHEFVLMNVGDEPLVIKQVLSSSANTTSEWTREPILPGKKGVVIGYINTTKRGGRFSKDFFVNSNATNRTPPLGYRLRLTGEVNDANIALK